MVALIAKRSVEGLKSEPHMVQIRDPRHRIIVVDRMRTKKVGGEKGCEAKDRNMSNKHNQCFEDDNYWIEREVTGTSALRLAAGETQAGQVRHKSCKVELRWFHTSHQLYSLLINIAGSSDKLEALIRKAHASEEQETKRSKADKFEKKLLRSGLFHGGGFGKLAVWQHSQDSNGHTADAHSSVPYFLIPWLRESALARRDQRTGMRAAWRFESNKMNGARMRAHNRAEAVHAEISLWTQEGRTSLGIHQ